MTIPTQASSTRQAIVGRAKQRPQQPRAVAEEGGEPDEARRRRPRHEDGAHRRRLGRPGGPINSTVSR